MKVTVIGAAGTVGSSVVDEALSRGQDVTAVVRRADGSVDLPGAVKVRVADAGKVEDVVALGAGQDVVISAIRSATSDVEEMRATTSSLMDGLAGTGVRLLIVGGAASLAVPGTDGRRVLDDPRFLSPDARRIGEASLAQYNACLSEQRVDWVYVCPPADLVSGRRTGSYRLGHDELLLDQQGRSRLSIADLAVVLLDEALSPRHHRTRITAAY